ncbi:hypothetical protein F4859DRAFT_98378 [Xylaria cf. heliscus]|nr:hypothetical protein F4859DRAFT_98378 [Xylaria cf. heliscus]
MSCSNKPKLDLLSSVFNHLVLPPQVPGAQDSDIDAVSHNVLARMLQAVGTAMSLTHDLPWQEAYQNLHESLQACLELNRGGLERSSLFEHLKKLDLGKVLILYLNEQNAGLLVRRDKDEEGEYVVFESFEASASSCNVIAAGHTMQWDFPGRSARIELNDFVEESFLRCLSTFLEQASMESIYNLQASTRKAGVSVTEIRDTTDPALITQMLMSLLEAIGDHHQAPVLRKRIRDDVNLTNTNMPWRRLPFWLVLRVAAQRHLCFTLGAEQGQIAYKYLIAILLAELLDESVTGISPHKVVYLRTKLARRMAKLEMNLESTKLSKDAILESWFTAASTVVRKSMEEATENVETSWNSFKRATTRRIPYLPHRAPEDSLQLTLPNSGRYLDGILATNILPPPLLGSDTLPDPLDQSIQQIRKFTDRAFELAELEQRIEQDASRQRNANQDHEDRCCELDSQIQNVLDTAGPENNTSPEQNSAIVLAVFTLWVELDKSAVAACHLLADHAPVFRPELLDALQLPTKSAMERLQKIQEHLADRHRQSTYGNILEIHNQDSIAPRYFAGSKRLNSLERQIKADYDRAREQKTREHDKLCKEYDEHTTGIAENRCSCTWEGIQRIVRGCTRCWHWRVRQRMKIRVQEAFLPVRKLARDTIVFELDIPNWLSAYRDATWLILSRLAHPYRPRKTQKPEIHLHECEPLQGYTTAERGCLSLASKIKCFKKTHYQFSQGRAPLTQVLLPFAADFRLYDSRARIWVEDLKYPPTLEHLAGIQIPASLLSILPKKHHPPTIVDGPTSYEIQANQAAVPMDMSAQAFSAYQKLLAGKRRRWPNLLVEMSSSNLNLSDENTTRVICQLASQAGPNLPNEPLRVAHEVFKDPAFTARLTTILENMLESIRENWREHNIMQLVICLTLRLFSLSSRRLGTTILVTARRYLLKWISELRKQVHSSAESTTAQQYATYGLYAALLCRATFQIHMDSNNHFSEEDLLAWVQASIAVQENILHDLSRVSVTLHDLLLCDAKMTYHLQSQIKYAMNSYRRIVGAEILRGWYTYFLDVEKPCSSWTFLPAPHERWIVAVTPDRYPARIHFNYIEGHLLVNGKPRLKLPLNIGEDDAVKFIFKDQHLLTLPSRLPGMSHQLARDEQGYQVHFGLRDGHAVIRAIRMGPWSRTEEIWEFVPKWRLRTLGSFDLPTELIDNCGHWLNLKTRCLEIRRASPNTSAFWNTRPKDWILNVPQRRAFRGEGGSQLVDPHSETFAQIADIFRDFEQSDKLTVFQPQSLKGKLTVELKHMDLQFAVNVNRLLWCRQLNAEIDPDQDPGTWYGLRSTIVMRETKTKTRNIIVPLGSPSITRNGVHVDVRIQGAQHYARFKIDNLLGRLSCGPEPWLIYTKALYHAVTSFCIRDSLTSRTGSAEAFNILQSGAAQPWTPVAMSANLILEVFEKLVPQREYYPPNIKRLQKVVWNPNLTSSIQCDGYRPLIEAIKEKSNNLQAFTQELGFELIETSHLCRRGRAQRQIFDPLLDVEVGQEIATAIYVPRDRRSGTEATQVYQIARVILSRCSQFHMERSLRSILESSNTIGGFSAQDAQHSVGYAGPLVSQMEDPITNWGELVDFCLHRASKADLLFRLGLLAFRNKADMDAINSFAAFSLVDEIKNLDPPQHESFENFPSCELPSIDFLESLMRPTYPRFQRIKNKKGKELLFDANKRVEGEHDKICKREGMELAKRIQQHWPISANQVTMEMINPAPTEHCNGHPRLLIDVSSAWDAIKTVWQKAYANIELSNYIARVDKILFSIRCGRDDSRPVPWRVTGPDFMSVQLSLSYLSIVQDWTMKPGPIVKTVESSKHGIIGKHLHDSSHSRSVPKQQADLAELERILQDFGQSGNSLRKHYAGDLRQSLAALENTAQNLDPEAMVPIPSLEALVEALGHALTRVRNIWLGIIATFSSHDNRFLWLELGAIRPLTAKIEILTLLRSTALVQFDPRMKEAIVSYGVALTDVQHLLRIRHALSRGEGNQQALFDELRHIGHENWEPARVTDWLLLEIDSDILIRAEQVAVARAIIDPKLGNGVLQLSMGKGKTSCIIPMVEALLADGQNLSRVIVPKALIMQTAQTIQSRLGGLVGRGVVHIPYSRRTPTDEKTLDLYVDIHHQTRQSQGIMLTCAEHLLSFKLFGWQKFIDSKKSTAHQMINFQNWLDINCRDVLDECDVTLSVKTQLNYPSGPEMPVDFHPYRWQIAQELLGLAVSHLKELKRKHPRGIQVTSRPEGKDFPAIQFLRTEPEDTLHNLIMDDILSRRLMLLRPSHPQSQHAREAIREVLYAPKISNKLLEHVADLFATPNVAINALLLVRGLLFHRILVMCLGKRWNVQYGLHPDRDPIAVPYEAKGKPSEQAEYGHPDVAILFTCLSFYYAGLTQDQLVQAVQNVLQSNDPAAQYEWWTSTCTKLPRHLRQWNVINADDKGQMEELWCLLRLNRIVINHYLNHFVFPIHARQFEVKLQACSWDIPICTKGDTQSTRTTGFSGTNDNKMVLPLTISQRDLPQLQHTSAEVLSYLLQERNRDFHVIANAKGERLMEKDFLRDLKEKRVSVLIDVGAYISEMRNEELAQAWLEVDTEAKAVVYFGVDNRAWVHYRSNAKEDLPLLATPLAENLSDCNVFLDEGHTRGVDLKLPAQARGAVTLALKLTKDHTVQAAMRLRQLRTTQSIVFYGPPEVEQSIRDFRRLSPSARIDSSHVTSWLLEQTCRSFEDLQGLYVAQGVDFCRRTDAIWHCTKFMTKKSERQTLLQVLKQPERKSLRELYGPSSERSWLFDNCFSSPQMRAFIDKLELASNDQQGRIQAGALEEVEQEREVEAQIEQVRQVEKRKKYDALKYPGLHPDIAMFALSGILKSLDPEKTEKPGFEHAFAFVGRTTIAKRFGVHETDSKLFVSSEFANTVKTTQDLQEGNNFLRPVEWIAWSTRTETALVVIPEEAEDLMKLLRGREGKSRVHLIAYAAPVTKAMLHFNRLEFYSSPELPKNHTIPERIRIELGILSGRLYVDQTEWEGLAEYLMFCILPWGLFSQVVRWRIMTHRKLGMRFSLTAMREKRKFVVELLFDCQVLEVQGGRCQAFRWCVRAGSPLADYRHASSRAILISV